TQLTMRTFHIGGAAFRQVEERGISFNYPVEIVSLPKHLIETENKTYTTSRRGEMKVRRVLAQHRIEEGDELLIFDGLWVNAGDTIIKRDKKEIKTALSGMVRFQGDKKFLVMTDERAIFIKPGAQIQVKLGELVPPNQVVAEFDPYNEPILTEVKGKIKLKDVVKARTVQEELDENTGLYKRVIIDDREGELQPYVTICDEKEEVIASYIMPTGARISVADGEEVNAGEVIAKLPLEIGRTKDITGGLPRVAELFEARHPKEKAIISEIDGVVNLGEISGRTRIVMVKNEATKDESQYKVPVGKHLKVHDQDRIASGERLTDGPIDCHDILRIKGEKALEQYLLNEIQEVYRLQGVGINDKHIEVIVRQMLKRVEITDGGDTEFLPGEQIDKFEFKKINEEVIAKGENPAQAKSILLGITKASLATDSFISAASFQETTKALTNASIRGAVDKLRGLKENVIVGRLIPAGTGRLKSREEILKYLKGDEVAV
ncbi:DNA-directed RNA polymerase subunit beta', partial [bacterium]|nr:DNA-directed RNA polymerase subunit beta' [bacterium]